VTEKQLREVVFETIRDTLLAEITALREDMRELRRYSRECLEQIRGMRAEFRKNMEYMHQQLERLTKMVESKFSEEGGDQPWVDSSKSWRPDDWRASAGSAQPSDFDRDLSQTEMLSRLRQMEHRLGVLEKALQRN